MRQQLRSDTIRHRQTVKLCPVSEFPQRVTLEITNRCNLSCPFCPRHFMDDALGDMDPHLFRRLVDELAAAGTKTLVPFFRGEPLMHPRCTELLSYAKDKGMAIQLATNGLLLKKNIAETMIDIGLDFISFSVDSINAEEYRTIRRGGSLETLLNAVDMLLSERQRRHSKLPTIQISAVDTGMNPEKKARFLSFWQARADRVRIYPQHSSDGKFGRLHHRPSMPRRPCLKPFRELAVYWHGRVAICNHDWNRKGSPNIGTEGITGVWKGSWYNAIRHRQERLEFTHDDICMTCDHWPQYSERHSIIGELVETG